MHNPKSILYKTPLKRPALIVGDGAIENAWAPVIRAIQPYSHPMLSSQGANCLMAQLVYQLRWFSGDPSEIGKKGLQQMQGHLVAIRQAIARELQAAETRGEIRARSELDKITEKFVLPCNEFLLVSTNWDHAIENALRTSPVMSRLDADLHVFGQHLHGDTDDPNTLYLPTEVTREPYRQAGEDRKIGATHSTIMSALETSERSIIYGLSFSPLDAELAVTIASGWDNDNLREIIIIDPDHANVAERVLMLLKRPEQVEVRGYNPANLDVSTRYNCRGI